MIESFSFPVLSAIVFIPIVAAVIILFMDGKQRDLIRGVAISTTVTLLVLSALVYFGYNAQVSALTAAQDEIASNGGEASASEMFNRGLAFEEEYDWVPDLGISYHGCGWPDRADGAFDGHGGGGRRADFVAR